MTEAAGTTAAEAAAQKPEAVGTQEVSRRVSLEVSLEASRKVSLETSRFPRQEIPQNLTYRWPQGPSHYLPQNYYLPRAYYLPEDCYLLQDLTY